MARESGSRGGMPAAVADIGGTRSLGYNPTDDLDAGLAAVWPEFDTDRATEA